MKNLFIDHSFGKIIEISNDWHLAKVIVEKKLEQLDEVANVIRANRGSGAVENVLNYRLTHRALSQCLEYINSSSSNISESDYFIYYNFLVTALQKAEQIVDAELGDLGL